MYLSYSAINFVACLWCNNYTNLYTRIVMCIYVSLLLLVDYRLVVICSNEEVDKCHIISRLHIYRRAVNPELKVESCRDYLQAHFVPPMELDSRSIPMADLYASTVDPNKYVHIT